MKLAFVHIPKTGGGSIHKWLRDHYERYKFSYHTGHKLLEEIEETNGKCDFTFTCTRNTYSRMVSLYAWTGIKNKKKLEKSYKRNTDPTEYIKIQDAHQKGIVPFLHYIKEHKPMLMLPQTEWVTGVDCIISLENINQDFKIIQEKVNCNKPLTKEVHKIDYIAKDFYTLEFKKTVELYFSEEIEEFKYLPKF